MLIKRYLICAGLALILFGCSSSQFGWRETPDSSDTEIKMNEEFDPLTLNDDDIKVETQKPAAAESDKKNDLSIEAEGVEKNSSEEFVRGFRVQLLATTDEKMARDEKKRAVFKFENKVYLLFEAPMYKIRVGDCLTRKDAETIRNSAVRHGFADAWIVPSKVIKH